MNHAQPKSFAEADATLNRILADCRTFPEIDAKVEAQMKEIKPGRAHWIIKPPQPGLTRGSYEPLRDMPWPKQGEY